MKKGELIEKLRILGLRDKETEKKIVCALLGHSKIIFSCLGITACGRCKAAIGGYLVHNASDKVIIGHNCDTCKENYKKLSWRDKFLVEDPFSDE